MNLNMNGWCESVTSTSFILSSDQARSKVNALDVKNSQFDWYMDYWLKQP